MVDGNGIDGDVCVPFTRMRYAVDREIGRFLDWLDRQSGLEETVVVVAGLQGQSLGNDMVEVLGGRFSL